MYFLKFLSLNSFFKSCVGVSLGWSLRMRSDTKSDMYSSLTKYCLTSVGSLIIGLLPNLCRGNS